MTRAAMSRIDRRWLALVVLCVGQLMIVLDATVVNVALPVIQRDLGFSQTSLAWVINGYLITFGGLLLLAGRVGDLLGRRRVFLSGLGIFTAASLLCGLAPSQGLLVGARFIQGVGAAVVASMVLAVIVTIFPEPRETAKAMSIYAFVASAGGSIGLLIGGALTEALSWHWIFFINIPIGVAAYVLGSSLIPRDQGIGLQHGVDVLGGALVTATPSLGVYAILQASDSGWASVRTLSLFAGAAALLVAFILRESTARTPLVPLRIFRSRTLVGANVLRLLFPVGLFGTFFLGVLYMQHILGYSSLQTGEAFLPQTLIVGAFSLFLTRRVVARFGVRPTLVAGLVSVSAGLALFSRVPVDGSYVVNLLPVTLLIGTGAGLIFAPSAQLAMSGVARSDVGLASGLANVALQMGAAVGVAVLASVSSAHSASLIAGGTATATALTEGYRLGFTIAAACALVAVAITAFVLRPARATVAVEERAPRPMPSTIVLQAQETTEAVDEPAAGEALVGAAAD